MLQIDSHTADVLFSAMLALSVFFIVFITFTISSINTMKLIPRQHEKYSPYTCWLFLIPLVQIIFMWVMLRFSFVASVERFIQSASSTKNLALKELATASQKFKKLTTYFLFFDTITIIYDIAHILFSIYYPKAMLNFLKSTHEYILFPKLAFELAGLILFILTWVMLHTIRPVIVNALRNEQTA